MSLLVVLGAAWLPGVANALPTGQIEVKSSQLDYASTGWGGWSCPIDHPFIVSASVENVGTGEGDLDPIILWKAGATAGAYTYPETPFGYTYGAGEEGAIAQNDGDGAEQVKLVLICALEDPTDTNETTPTTDVGSGGEIPATGSSTTPMVLLGLLLVASGTGLVVARRKA